MGGGFAESKELPGHRKLRRNLFGAKKVGGKYPKK
jgi:hypothetical protein